MHIIYVAIGCIVYGGVGFLLYRGRALTDIAILNSDLLVFTAPAVTTLLFNWLVLKNASRTRVLSGGKAGAPFLIAFVATFLAHWCYMAIALTTYGS